jgi:hypothetical protein
MASIQPSQDELPDFRTYLGSAYESVLNNIDPIAAKRLAFGAARLAAAVRKAVDLKVDVRAPGRAAERWLAASVGAVDDPLRRAAVAAVALGSTPEADIIPTDIMALYPTMHARLARFLVCARAYDGGQFSADIALAARAYAPLGPLTIAVPTSKAPSMSLPRIKRAGAMARRHWQDRDLGAAIDWLAAWRARPWVELHVDIRNLGEFNAEGFVRGYHRLADLMALRPDLPGVYGASWLYQPELAQISPNLAFARETAEAGGGPCGCVPTRRRPPSPSPARRPAGGFISAASIGPFAMGCSGSGGL